MTPINLLAAFLIASAFVFWPTIGKYSQVSGAWINTLVLLFSTLAGGLLALPAMRAEALPSLKGIAILVIAGVINGAAVYYYTMKTADSSVPTGSFIMTVNVGMLIVALVLSYFINGEAITPRKVAGIATAFIAIYLIAGN